MTQLRRSVTPALAALLHSDSKLQPADLYTITLSGGTVLRWTAHDQPVTVDGLTWTIGPLIERELIEWAAGMEAVGMRLVLGDSDDNPVTVGGVRIVPWVHRGGLDGAEVVLDKAFREELAGAAWVGRIEQTWGRVSDITPAGRGQVRVDVRGPTEVFEAPLPAGVYQPQCRNEVYDAACGLSRSAFTTTSTASSATDSLRLVFSHTLAQPAGYFDLGAVTFLTGANAGQRRTVRSHTSGQLTAMQPWPAPVAPGDAFQVYPGCDGALSTCTTKFSRRSHFRGTPFIPPPETVL